jgi:hypothetical protein
LWGPLFIYLSFVPTLSPLTHPVSPSLSLPPVPIATEQGPCGQRARRRSLARRLWRRARRTASVADGARDEGSPLDGARSRRPWSRMDAGASAASVPFLRRQRALQRHPLRLLWLGGAGARGGASSPPPSPTARALSARTNGRWREPSSPNLSSPRIEGVGGGGRAHWAWRRRLGGAKQRR